MKKTCVCAMLAMAFLVSRTMAQTPPSAESILARTDQNAVSGNKIILSAMTIHGRRDSRSISSKSWIQGKDKAFTEYLAPAREKGIKMLKLGDQLWTYSPDADRTISISGHMLRQSVMGSDLSYEDMLEDRELQTIYNARVVGEETVLERPCWVLELTSKGEEVAYYSRKVWVDKERFVVLKEEMYAKSNKLLKTLEVKSVIRVQGRWVQNVLVFKDVLKGGEGTEFKITAIEFEAAIPEYIFSKASLRK
ncbi:MAG: outer membrane lipoprotein-sorting protein [Candidatus Aminicenantes bacterium]|nr:outer membrane lipoprotein-sorting protein [Candidatus Aminicenantes bacterium]